MSEPGPRYAVYFVPAADTGLYRFGSAVLQYDCYTGRAVPPLREFDADCERWHRDTEEPRRYGFHATMKAPFHLPPSRTEAELVGAFESFAARRRPAAIIMPAPRFLGGFVALMPETASDAVDALAADCTAEFEAFRAPMSAPERARRLAAGLNQGQIENLDRWGYPYVFAEFRFHMTLTGRIESARQAVVLEALQTAFERACGRCAMAIDRLALARQDSDGSPFRVIAQAGLTFAA